VRVAFDSSVLVAASLANHPHNERALVWLDAVQRGEIEGSTTTHALAELWATLTALPNEPRPTFTQVESVVARLSQRLDIVELTHLDYKVAMTRCSEREVGSGRIFDALHLVAAERSDATILLTFNTRHFLALQEKPKPAILAPPDPPSLLEPGQRQH
jgi:predicted nucleic acid-binding protein